MAMICRGASRSSDAVLAYKQLAYYCWPTDDSGAHFDDAAHTALRSFVTQLAKIPVCDWVNIILSDHMTEKYKQDVKSYFRAQEFSLKDWEKVNAKVRQVTKIQSDVLQSQPAGGTSVLINAIYFLDKWVFPFNEGDTGMLFRTIDNKQKYVNMMTHQKTIRVAKHGPLTAVNMLYRTPGMGAWFVKNSTPTGFQDAVAFETLSSFLQQEFVARTLTSSEERLILRIPKFELEHDIDLKSVFQKLDTDAHPITEIFTAGHIDRMSTAKDEYFSFFKQKCILKVDQKGTKAAAVTASGTTRGTRPEPYYSVTFAHTFYMVIYHHDTILFVAKIGSPQEVVESGRAPDADTLPDTTKGHVSSHFAHKEQNLQVGLTIKFITVNIGGTMREIEVTVKEHDGRSDEEGECIDAAKITNVPSPSQSCHTTTYTVNPDLLIRVTIRFPRPDGITDEESEATKIGFKPEYVKDTGEIEAEDRIELDYDESKELEFPLQKEAGEEEDGWQFRDDKGNVFLKLRFKLKASF